MAFDELHRHVARIALMAAGRKYGVALAGGNALMVHEVVSRHTEDVDLFVRRLGNVAPAAAEIQAALEAAGYATERLDAADAGGLGDLWPEAGEELAEWEVTTPDGEHTVQVQVAYFETLADPVTVPDLGPVLALEDLAGWKTVALANRMAARDYVDIAQLLKQYTVPELIALALERDPGLHPADFADAGRHLDQMRDSRLAALLTGLDGEDAAWLRAQFAAWPRAAAPRDEPLPAAVLMSATPGAPAPPARRRSPRIDRDWVLKAHCDCDLRAIPSARTFTGYTVKCSDLVNKRGVSGRRYARQGTGTGGGRRQVQARQVAGDGVARRDAVPRIHAHSSRRGVGAGRSGDPTLSGDDSAGRREQRASE